MRTSGKRKVKHTQVYRVENCICQMYAPVGICEDRDLYMKLTIPMRRDTSIEIGRTYASVLVAVRVAYGVHRLSQEALGCRSWGNINAILGYPYVRLVVAAHPTLHWPPAPSFAFT